MAPEAVNVVELPAQMEAEEALAVTVGFGLTVKEIVLVFTHPLAFVPLTVYNVVVLGVTLTLLPEIEPGIHVYVTAPVDERVEELPEQILVGLALAIIVGLGIIFIVIVLLEVQPNVFEPVTVYVVVTLGVTVIELPVNPPGAHV